MFFWILQDNWMQFGQTFEHSTFTAEPDFRLTFDMFISLLLLIFFSLWEEVSLSTIFMSNCLLTPTGLISWFCLRKVGKSDRISLSLIGDVKCFDYIQLLLVIFYNFIHFLPALAHWTLLKHPSSYVQSTLFIRRWQLLLWFYLFWFSD